MSVKVAIPDVTVGDVTGMPRPFVERLSQPRRPWHCTLDHWMGLMMRASDTVSEPAATLEREPDLVITTFTRGYVPEAKGTVDFRTHRDQSYSDLEPVVYDGGQTYWRKKR